MEFNTKDNLYYWDNDVGIFIPSIQKKTIYKKGTNRFYEKQRFYHVNWLEKWDKIPKVPHKNSPDVTVDSIKEFIFRFGFTQLTLELTQDCNFRCPYCIFSDNYESTRNHSKSYMSFSTAKKAIDYYYSLIKKYKGYNPLRKPVVGFFGGEPLLNFAVLKKCVEYIKSHYGNETLFAITTNGSLMNKEVGEWLIKNDFKILISLNGHEKEHNRLRRYGDGKKTFKDVMENINHITSADYEDIGIVFVYDYDTDLFACEEFFKQKNIPRVEVASLVSNAPDSHYFDKFKEKKFLNFIEQFEKAKNYYMDSIIKGNVKSEGTLFERLFAVPLYNDLNKCNTLYHSSSLMPFTNACIPGQKMFVDVNGQIHICERVNQHFPIGAIDDGLDFERICALIQDYQLNFDKCKECQISKLCDKCYVQFMVEKKFVKASKICEEAEELLKKRLSIDFKFLEKDIAFFETLNFQ